MSKTTSDNKRLASIEGYGNNPTFCEVTGKPVSDSQRKRLTVAARFAQDHYERDLPTGVLVGQNTRYFTYSVTRDEAAEWASDARHNGSTQMCVEWAGGTPERDRWAYGWAAMARKVRDRAARMVAEFDRSADFVADFDKASS